MQPRHDRLVRDLLDRASLDARDLRVELAPVGLAATDNAGDADGPPEYCPSNE